MRPVMPRTRWPVQRLGPRNVAELSATTFWTFVREFSPLWVYASLSRES